MNEPRKSDSLVVPMKSPNKAGQPAAEAVEGRGLAKGNPHQQNAPRTQCRTSVCSALERVRQAAFVRCAGVTTQGKSRMRENRTSGSVEGHGQPWSLVRPIPRRKKRRLGRDDRKALRHGPSLCLGHC
jgi:hypothetical protein